MPEGSTADMLVRAPVAMIAQVGDATITASCEGSGGSVYRQTIHLRESAKATLLLVDATCTCPVRIASTES